MVLSNMRPSAFFIAYADESTGKVYTTVVNNTDIK